MKNSLEHLPVNIQEELNRIAEICESIEMVQMVILFGSFARGDWIDDTYQDQNGTFYRYQSDYDLLIVLRSEQEARHSTHNGKLERKIIRHMVPSKPLSTIFHGIQYLNDQIEKRSYFFYDIYNEGVMLYDNGEHLLAKPQMISKRQRYEKALAYYDKWFASSNKFFRQFYHAIDDEAYDIAAFDLHQTTERFFNTIQLVFTDYRPKLHDLEELYKYVRICDQRFGKVFPLETEEEQRLFKILKDAYIDSRYKLDYSIEEDELKYLENRVKILRDMTEEICQEQLKKFEEDMVKQSKS